MAPHVAAEFPGLGIAWVEVEAQPGAAPSRSRRRLRGLSDRFYGAQAIQMRQRPIPWAYRVFFRQIGLDPDRPGPRSSNSPSNGCTTAPSSAAACPPTR